MPKGVVAMWCNPLNFLLEQTGKVDSIPDRAPPLEHHDKGLWTQLACGYFFDLSTCTK